MSRFCGRTLLRQVTMTGLLLLAGVCLRGPAIHLQAQEQPSPPHRTYADDQAAADAQYQKECGNLSLKDCNSQTGSLEHRQRVRAYRNAINAILRHLAEENMKRSDPQTQSFVYLLGSDSEKADLPDRAYMFYRECTRILSSSTVTAAEIPNVVENSNTVSAKSACETAAARWKSAPGATAYSETTVTVETTTGDVWEYVAISSETEPAVEILHNSGGEEKPQPAERAAGRADGAAVGAAAGVAVAAELTAIAAKAAEKEAKAAKKQANAEAKAAKAEADAPAKAAKKEERERARSEREARRQEEGKEHDKKD